MKIRVHTDMTTIDVPQDSEDHDRAEMRANNMIIWGVWEGDKLWPPSRIVMVELIPS